MSILDPTGMPVYRERQLSQHDAEQLRHYKKTFLERHGYRERLWCAKCEEAGQPEGVRAFVTDNRIGITCRCTSRHYTGATY